MTKHILVGKSAEDLERRAARKRELAAERRAAQPPKPPKPPKPEPQPKEPPALTEQQLAYVDALIKTNSPAEAGRIAYSGPDAAKIGKRMAKLPRIREAV